MAAVPSHRDERIAHLRVPPHNTAAEQEVLGSLLLSPKAWDVVGELLTEDDFYRHDHRILFRAVQGLAEKGRPFDAVTLGEWLESQGLAQQIGGMDYVLELASTQTSAANVRAHAEIVRQKSLLRRIIDGCSRVVSLAFEPGDKGPDAIIDSAVGGLMKLQKRNIEAEFSMAQAMQMAYAQMIEAADRGDEIPGLTTGLAKLDEHLGGLHQGDLTVIGGRPSMGKTAMLLGMVRAGALKQPVGLISGEQPAAQIGMRMMSLASGVHGARMRNGKLSDGDWHRASNAIAQCGPLPVQILDRSAPTLGEVTRAARRWKRERGIRALYVDYLQRIEAPGEKAFERVALVARGLKTLARDLDISIVALAQVKREVEQRTDKRPRMGDLCDSSEIEKEADQIALLYRDDYYNTDSPDKGTAEIILDKNRHGPTGFVRVAWSNATMRFGDLDPEWQHQRNAEPPEDHGKQAGRSRKAKALPARDGKAEAGGE